MPPATKAPAAKATRNSPAENDSAADERYITIPAPDLEAMLTRMLDERLAGLRGSGSALDAAQSPARRTAKDRNKHGGLDKVEVARLVRSDVTVLVPVRDKDGKPRRDKETKRIITTVRQADPGDIVDFRIDGDTLTLATIDGRKLRFRKDGNRYRPVETEAAPEREEEDAA